MDGLRTEAVKAFGPVQLQVAPGMSVASSCRVVPARTGLLLKPFGLAGALMFTSAEHVLPAWSVTTMVPAPQVPVVGTTRKVADVGPAYSSPWMLRLEEPGPSWMVAIPT